MSRNSTDNAMPATPRRSDSLRRSIPRPVSMVMPSTPTNLARRSSLASSSNGPRPSPSPLARQASAPINAGARTPANPSRARPRSPTLSIGSSAASVSSRGSKGSPEPNRHRTISTMIGTPGRQLASSARSLPGVPGRSYKQRYSAYGEPTLSLAIELDELTQRYSFLEDRYTEAEERLRILEGCDRKLEVLEHQFQEMSAENAHLKEENVGLVLQWVNSREEIAKTKKDAKGEKRDTNHRAPSPTLSPIAPSILPQPLVGDTQSEHSEIPSDVTSTDPHSSLTDSSEADVKLSHTFISRAFRNILKYASDFTDSLPFAVSKVSLQDADFSKTRIPSDILELIRNQTASPGGFLQTAIVFGFASYFCSHMLDVFRPGLDGKTNRALDKIRVAILTKESSRTYFTWRSTTYRNLAIVCDEDVDVIRDTSSQISKIVLSLLAALIPPDKEFLLTSCQDIVKGSQKDIANIIEDALKYVHLRKIGLNTSEGGERTLIPKKGDEYNPERMEVPIFVDGKGKDREQGKVYRVVAHLMPGVWSAPGSLEQKALVLIEKKGGDVF
ncbi:hypothetical protein BT69DRAFT_1288846, partial [Atractiella rhizophila]